MPGRVGRKHTCRKLRSSMPCTRIWPIMIVLAFACAVGAARGDDISYVEPPSVEAQLMIEGVRIDGSLDLSFDLGSWSLGPRESLPLRIVHGLKRDFAGHVYSDLAITGLAGCAVPADRLHTRCLLPGDYEVRFANHPLGTAFQGVGPGVLARRPTPKLLEIALASGWRWVFENGSPVAGAGPNLLRLDCEAQGAKITHLRASRVGGMVGELTAQYDNLGALKDLKYGNRRHRFIFTGPRHQLSEWISIVDGQERRIHFEYSDEVLMRAIDGETVLKKITWEEVPGGRTSDSEWPAPLRVATLGRLRFKYELNYKGYALWGEDVPAGTQHKRTFNPTLGTIEVVENGELLRRVFFGANRGRPDAGKVTRVENARREVAVKYAYDAFGRVSSFWSGGEGEKNRLDFTYDQNGRRQIAAAANSPKK